MYLYEFGGAGKTIKMDDWGDVWLQSKVRDGGLGLRPRLYAGSVCDESAAYAALVAINK